MIEKLKCALSCCRRLQGNHSLEDFIAGDLISNSVSAEDEEEADDGLEEADRCGETIVAIHETHPVDERVNDVPFAIDQRIVQVKNLIETDVQHLAD